MASPSRPQATTVLTLYVVGKSERSQAAIDQFRRLREHDPDQRWQCKVVDLLEHREMAGRHRIMVAPTLVREAPLPVRRLVGDLSDPDEVRVALGLHHPTAPTSGPAD